MGKSGKGEKHNLRIGKVFGVFSGIASVFSWLGISVAVLWGFLCKTWLWLIPVAILAIVLFFLWFCKHNHKRIIGWIQGLLAPNLPYRLTRWEIEYEYKSMNEMRYHADYEVQAMQTGVDHIRVRYNWSGETEDNPIYPVPVTEHGYQTGDLRSDGKEYGYNYYKVMSKTQFNKEDGPFKLGVRIAPLKVGKRPVSHHLLASISMATDVLVMRVLLPPNIRPTRIECFEYLHATDDYHWHKYEWKAEQGEDGKYEIEWEISRPIYGGKYVIKWEPKILAGGQFVPGGSVEVAEA